MTRYIFRKPNFRIGVIISTYNNPQWLEKTLWGYENQTLPPDEIVIADDGSGEDTRCLIESFQKRLPIKHVWQEDQGFQKNRILNKAIMATTADYLIFTDQDCVPREDFVATHAHFAKKGCYLSGGYFKLPMKTSQLVDRDVICSRDVFQLSWLLRNGVAYSFKCTKLFRSKFYAWLLNSITPARATWNGCNASGWKEDIVAVNGYNEDMSYGGEDCELGERMQNYGIRPRQIRYSAVLLHLDHSRPYRNKRDKNKNNAIRTNTRNKKVTFTPNGIKKYMIIKEYRLS